MRRRKIHKLNWIKFWSNISHNGGVFYGDKKFKGKPKWPKEKQKIVYVYTIDNQVDFENIYIKKFSKYDSTFTLAYAHHNKTRYWETFPALWMDYKKFIQSI